MILIDAHGETHGLKVAISNRSVEIEQWGELCEPDHDGNVHPHTTHAYIDLRECLEFADKSGRWHDSQRDRVINGALDYLAHWGGEQTHYNEGTRPCAIFDHDPAVRCDHCANLEFLMGEIDDPDLVEFITQYVETLLWSTTDMNEDGDMGLPLDETHELSDFDGAIGRRVISDCRDFVDSNRDAIGDRFGQAGHDFALTRNGHGAGFWDGDWPEPAASELTRASKSAGSVDLFVDSDGGLYGH